MKNKLTVDYLFTRYHNEMAVAAYRILQDLDKGKTYTPREVEQKLSRFDTTLEALKHDLMLLFFQEEDGLAQSRIADFSLPDLPPGLPEQRWLKTMLNDDRVSFLLSPQLRQKLNERLQDVPLLNTDKYRIVFHDDTTKEPLHTSLVHFRQSLQEQKQITLTLTDGKSLRCYPFRLDFNAINGRFSYWISENGTDFQRIPVRNVTAITLEAKKIPDLHAAFEEFLQSQQKEVRLEVTFEQNAVERCFYLFSSYRKESQYDEQTKQYILNITYYAFDEKEVLNNILSLGNEALVLGPEDIRQKVIDRLKAIVAAYPKER